MSLSKKELVPRASQVALMVKNLPANAGDSRDTSLIPGFKLLEVSWSKKWQTAPISLPGKFHRQRNLVGYSPGDRRESDMTK